MSTPPILVEITIKERINDELPIPDNPHFKGILTDISGGGAALREDKTKLPFLIKDVVEMVIHLESDPIRIEGKILNRMKRQGSDKWIFGLQFNRIEVPVLQMRKNIARILRYVMKRQREIFFK